MPQTIPGTTPLYPDIDLATQTLAGTPIQSGMGKLPLIVDRVLRPARYVVQDGGTKMVPEGWWVQVQLLGKYYFAEVETEGVDWK